MAGDGFAVNDVLRAKSHPEGFLRGCSAQASEAGQMEPTLRALGSFALRWGFVLPLHLSAFAFRHLKSQPPALLPSTLTCHCTDSFHVRFALVWQVKWAQNRPARAAAVTRRVRAESCCSGSTRMGRKPLASRSGVQDYTLVQNPAAKPRTNTGNVNAEAKQRDSSAFRAGRCKNASVSGVSVAGGKGGRAPLAWQPLGVGLRVAPRCVKCICRLK